MSNNFRNGIMRRMRQYTKAVQDNYRSRDAEIKKYDQYKSVPPSPYYKQVLKDIDKIIEDNRIRLFEEVRKDLITTLADMRQAAGQRSTKAPSADMVNSLAILATLDNIPPTQMKFYVDQMSDCPLAMQRLQQIAATHNMKIQLTDLDAIMSAINKLEGKLTAYLGSFRGDDNPQSPTVIDMCRYFQPEEYYAKGINVSNNPLMPEFIHSAKEADYLFWKDQIGYGSPAMFDGPAAGNTPQVQYFFGDLDGLTAFINKATEDKTGSEIEKTENEILTNCPEQYGAAYRCYKATGEKIALNGTESEGE